MPNFGFDPARLYSQLQITGLAVKDNPLWQLLFQMIGAMNKIRSELNAGAASGGGGSSSVVNNTIFNAFMSDVLGSNIGQDGEIGPPGLKGIDGEDGLNGMVPYYIAPGETFTVPEYKQALFAMNIDNEGILEVDGFLIEVDREGSGGVSDSEFIVTTVGNIDDLDFGDATVIRMNNASLATIRGLKAGTDGQTVTIISVNAQVDLAHQNTSSLAANRLLNLAASAPSSLNIGSVTYVYDITTARWRMTTHNQGNWISSPFNAADFTANGATIWVVGSGDVNELQYRLRGNELLVTFALINTSVTVATSVLLNININQFGGYLIKSIQSLNTCLIRDSTNGFLGGFCQVQFGNSFMSIFKTTVTDFILSTNDTDMYGQVAFEVL